MNPRDQPRRFRRPCVRWLWVCVFLISAVPAHAQQKPAPSSDPLVRMNEAMDALTRKVLPSIVQILVSGYGAGEDGSRTDTRAAVVGPQQSSGSGFVIDVDGYVMTNAHVVSGARRVQVVLPAENADGTLASALSGKTYTLPARSTTSFTFSVDSRRRKL